MIFAIFFAIIVAIVHLASIYLCLINKQNVQITWQLSMQVLDK